MLQLEHYKYDAARCVGCKGCVWVDHIYMPGVQFGMKCPSAACYLFDSYAPYGRMKIALAVMEGRLPYSDKLADIVYSCTMCGACDAGCKRNLDLEPLLLLEAFRQRCVAQGYILPQHRAVAERIRATHNYFGRSHEDRARWWPEDVKKTGRGKGDVLYFTGCSSSYVHKEISQSIIRLLQKAKIAVTHLGSEEWCCGYSLVTTGQVEEARHVAVHNIEAALKSGAGTILVGCAECYKTWKVEYPKLLGKSTADMGYQVVHASEYLAGLVQDGTLAPGHAVPMKVTYHDPCNLGRLSEPWTHWEGTRGRFGTLQPPKEYRRGTYGVYEPPRQILNNIPGIELVDMPRHRENAWCCGFGGGVRDAFPQLAGWAAGERVTEAQSVGAEAIVSGCPWCKAGMQQAVRESRSPVEVLDVVEVLARAVLGRVG
ncbi:MAG: (Fe-S)-binding protein [Clostridia bacterium]|nr:MAG: (Fe-S)-binding protein [Clostridia bacterium]